MPNVMAAQPNIGGAFCESSVIPFLVPRRKVWLTPAANIDERKTGTQSGKIPPKMYIWCTSPGDGQDRAKFGGSSVSDVAAVTKPRRETH